MTNELFMNIVMALITIAGAICTAYIVPWLKSRIGKQEFDKMVEYIRIAVRCAEQIYTPEEWEQKKQYVFNYIKALIGNVIKINLTDEQLDSIIEGIVNEVKKGSPYIQIASMNNFKSQQEGKVND